MAKQVRAFVCIFVVSLALVVAKPARSQEQTATNGSVPHLVQYAGKVPDSTSGAVRVTFSLYAEQSGGEAVWSETQQITPDNKGRYAVLLGAETPGGLPQQFFSSAEAKWLGVRIDGVPEGARMILVATPYSLKASDADTLAGHPVTDFTLASGVRNGKPEAGVDITQVNAGTGITVTGNGTATVTVGLNTAYLASLAAGFAVRNGGNSFTGAQSITGNLSVSGTITSPYLNSVAAQLANLTGANTFHGLQTLAPLGSAKSTGGFNSNAFRLSASAFNSTASAAELINFQWQVEPAGNNTASPSGTLNLLYGTGTNAPAETGLKIASNGRLTFPGGQTFPGAGTITDITTTSPLAGGGTSGTVALSLNTSALKTTLNGVYGALSANNTWSGPNNFTGPLTAGVFSEFEGAYFIGQARGLLSVAAGCCGQLSNSFPGGFKGGVEGDGQAGLIGVGNALVSNSPSSTWGVAGILQNHLVETVSQEGIAFAGGTNAGVWGDSVEQTGQSMALLGTADGNTALMVVNNSPNPTSEAYNYTSSGNGIIFATYSPNVSSGSKNCVIDASANLTCSGSITPVVAGMDGRPTAMYAVASTENWFEDFGSGELHAGAGHVALDPAFAAIISTGMEYHVFLTPKGDCKGLYIAAEGAAGFEVRELGSGASSVAFDYRIVGKRKGYESVRMQDMTAQTRAAHARMEEHATRIEESKGKPHAHVLAPQGAPQPAAQQVAPVTLSPTSPSVAREAAE